MRISSWLKNWKTSPRSRNKSQAALVAVEQMEPRTLLSASVLLIGGQLNVSLHTNENVQVSAISGNLIVQTSSGSGLLTPVTSIGTVSASSVTSIVVTGGDQENTIDLGNVRATDFTKLTSIKVSAGNGNDTITGSPDFGDSLSGGDGADLINSQGGNDTIDGGNGQDTINAGIGDDSILAGDGADSVDGNDGNDTIDGGNGSDTITAGNGNDSVLGGNGEDSITGDAGDDTINSDGGSDTVLGGDGNDSILGGELNDVLQGGIGNDTIDGQAGDDTIDGQAGDDSLLGGNGNDSLIGNSGNDVINGGIGNDTAQGTDGNDTIYGGAGNDSLDGGIGNDIELGQAGNDTVLGGGGADSLDGGVGNDLIQSGDAGPGPTISVVGGSVLEGNTGTTNLPFTLTLTQVSATPITVTVSTADGSATAGSDYVAITNQLVTFAPGTTTQIVNVQVNGDKANEVDETVRLIMSTPTGALLQNQEGVGTITNDDPVGGLFAISGFGSPQQLVSISATNAATTLIAATTTNNSFDIEALDSSTVIGIDNQPNPRLYTMSLTTGAILSSIPITNLTPDFQSFDNDGDIAYDPTTNSVFAYISNGASLGGRDTHLFRIDATTGNATDVGALTAGGANLRFFENDYLAMRNGTLYGIVTDSFDPTIPSESLFTINSATAACTLVAPVTVPNGVFLSSSGSMTYDSNLDEFFVLDGFGRNLLTVNPTTGVGTLVGNTGFNFQFDHGGLADTGINPPAVPPRTISVNDVSISEGNQGTQTLTFNVTCQPGAGNVTMSYQTADGTATAGSDYVAKAGALTFTAAGGTQTVSVTVNGDTTFESDETFFLQLSNVNGAVIAKGSGVGTILNDDTLIGDTLLGSDGNDTIFGSAAGDSISGGNGNDLVFANDGNDSVTGGSGMDTLNGEAGDDTLNGQGGNDVLDGGSGNDTNVWDGASSGNDVLGDTVGDNTLLVNGNGASNVFSVGQNSDRLLTVSELGKFVTVGPTFNTVVVDGGTGDDTINIGTLDKVQPTRLDIRGGAGDDSLTGSGAIGAVRLSFDGGDGNDTIQGGIGDETILGGAGNDNLNGGAGNDTVSGGDGDDTVQGGDGNDSVSGDAGADVVRGNNGDDIGSGGDGNDTLDGGYGNDTMSGDDGFDSVIGSFGNDSLLGGLGADTLDGGDGNDTLDGGYNNDSILGGNGDDRIRGDHGNDTIDAGAGDDLVSGGDGNDVINGGLGADSINGGDGDDIINGGSGNDLLAGGDGNDTLLGGSGNDILLGEDGNDFLNGQSGTDTIAGNQGVDVIVDPVAEINEAYVLPASLRSLLDTI